MTPSTEQPEMSAQPIDANELRVETLAAMDSLRSTFSRFESAAGIRVGESLRYDCWSALSPDAQPYNIGGSPWGTFAALSYSLSVADLFDGIRLAVRS